MKKIFYTVHVYIQDSVAPDWLAWMIRVHIPDVMKTRCFDGTEISELINPVKKGFVAYQIRYSTTEVQLARYQSNFAARLQKEHTERYRGQFEAARFITQKMSD